MRIIQNHYVLAVHDVDASARFYVGALGFEIVAKPEGWIFVRRDECTIMLGECPDDMHPSELGCHNYFSYLRVDDVDAYHARILASGLTPRVGPIADQPWRMREFTLTTPDGHRVTVGQTMAERTPTAHCCDAMKDQFEIESDDERLLFYSSARNEYGIVDRVDPDAHVLIAYCPWCGRDVLPARLTSLERRNAEE